MTDHEFQLETVKSFGDLKLIMGRLETKMDALVGADGTGGVIADHAGRISALEEADHRTTARRTLMQTGLTAGSGILGALVARFWK